MQRRPLLVGALVALVGAALILFWVQRGADAVPDASAGAATASVTTAPTPTPSATSPTATPDTAEPPPSTAVSTGATLRIPGIDLAAGLHPEGLREGKINPPAGTVMWFTGYDRVAPGAVGTSVIAGHVVAGGRSDVFANLSRVRVGDRVELAGTDGTTRAFTVVRAGVVDKDDLTTDQTVWGGNSSVRRLAIITCDDAYGFRGDGHRVANYVVIAEPA
jgi:LPXTG-site transpeptidase (sortase) family protein